MQKKPAARIHYDHLSFRSGEEGKGCVQRIGQEGRSSRDAIDHSGLSFPKETVQPEAEGGSEVEWETQVVGVPTVL